MMGLNFILGICGIAAVVLGYSLFKIKKANDELNRVLQSNADLIAKNKVLAVQKATAETQIKNATTRQKNAENTLNSNRSQLIDSLWQSDDLRD